MKLSPYRAQLYEKCPRQFKFVVIDDLSDKFASPRPYLTMGAHVHNTLKDIYDLPAVERTADALETILRKRWKENRSGFVDKDEERNYGQKAMKMLRLFAHKQDLSRNPAALEEFKSIDIAPEVQLCGRIDRIDEENDGLHIIDYKTGLFNEAWVSPAQLKLYAVMAASDARKPVKKASFLYLPSHTWYSIEIDDDLLQETVDSLLERVEAIKTDTEYLANVGDHCKFCDFHDICPEKEAVHKLLDTNHKNARKK